MNINAQHLDRIKQSQMRGEAVATIFEVMAQQMEMLGAQATSYSMDYQRDGDVVGENDLIPVITLSLRPATVGPA
jgi:hypothetical protein